MVDEQLHCLFDKKRRSFNFALKRLKNNFGSSGKMKAKKTMPWLKGMVYKETVTCCS